MEAVVHAAIDELQRLQTRPQTQTRPSDRNDEPEGDQVEETQVQRWRRRTHVAFPGETPALRARALVRLMTWMDDEDRRAATAPAALAAAFLRDERRVLRALRCWLDDAECVGLASNDATYDEDENEDEEDGPDWASAQADVAARMVECSRYLEQRAADLEAELRQKALPALRARSKRLRVAH